MDGREVRRSIGLLARASGDLALHQVEDPRESKSRKWALPALLKVLFLGLLSGCRSLGQTERLSAQLSPALRPKLKVFRRVPDTTMRALVMRLPLDAARALIRRGVKLAHRRHALEPVGLPCGVVAIDGKSTRTRLPDEVWAQKQKEGQYVVRTLSVSLVSAQAAVCLDAVPIAKEQSESSAFPEALASLQREYGNSGLFEIITADAGISDASNAGLVHQAGLGYVFAVKGDQPTLFDEATRLLANLTREESEHEDIDTEGQLTVVRHIWRTHEINGFHDWEHLRTAVRVETERIDSKGETVSCESRYFLTNVLPNRLSAQQWIRLVRWHWRVENDVHQTLDVALGEDDHPWLDAAYGLLLMALLRRVALNLLLLYRNVSRRGERKAAIPWRELLDDIRFALRVADERHLEGLRWQPRHPATLGQPPPVQA